MSIENTQSLKSFHPRQGKSKQCTAQLKRVYQMMGVYYKLSALPDEVRSINKIRSNARLDYIYFTDIVTDNSNGLTNFVNHKWQIFFHKIACKEFVNTDSERLSEWSLTFTGLNFSSIDI